MQLDEKMRENIALKKFSIIAPVLNGQVENQKNYFTEICDKPIELPHYGERKYTPKTLQYWASSYLRGGIDALKPGWRSDKGKSRKINIDIIDKVKEIKTEYPKMKTKMIYEKLLSDRIVSEKDFSLPTFYRFMEDAYISKKLETNQEEKDMKRFSHEYINELWQTDTMYGPYIREGRIKRQTYLLAYIDDASRLCTHAEFYYSQNFNCLRDSFREAVLKRGVPKMLYTDNGKIYRSQQLEYICASLGCSLIHAKILSPYQKGKIERFFHTVRMRFLSSINADKIKSIDELNLNFRNWLENDYQRKEHSSIGMSPLDFFMSQVSRIKIFSSPDYLNECFLIRVSRKINKDATLQLDSILYETDQKFAGERLEVRYDPKWLSEERTPVLLYRDGKKIGEALKVNFKENACIKRRYNGNRRKPDNCTSDTSNDNAAETDILSSKSTISFSDMIGEGGGR